MRDRFFSKKARYRIRFIVCSRDPLDRDNFFNEREVFWLGSMCVLIMRFLYKQVKTPMGSHKNGLRQKHLKRAFSTIGVGRECKQIRRFLAATSVCTYS